MFAFGNNVKVCLNLRFLCVRKRLCGYGKNVRAQFVLKVFTVQYLRINGDVRAKEKLNAVVIRKVRPRQVNVCDGSFFKHGIDILGVAFIINAGRNDKSKVF